MAARAPLTAYAAARLSERSVQLRVNPALQTLRQGQELLLAIEKIGQVDYFKNNRVCVIAISASSSHTQYRPAGDLDNTFIVVFNSKEARKRALATSQLEIELSVVRTAYVQIAPIAPLPVYWSRSEPQQGINTLLEDDAEYRLDLETIADRVLRATEQPLIPEHGSRQRPAACSTRTMPPSEKRLFTVVINPSRTDHDTAAKKQLLWHLENQSTSDEEWQVRRRRLERAVRPAFSLKELHAQAHEKAGRSSVT